MSLINKVSSFVRNITTSKAAKLSTDELKAKLPTLRAQAAAAKDAWRDAGEDDNPWSPPSADTDHAEGAYRAAQSRLNNVEKELRRRGVDISEPSYQFKDSYRTGASGNAGPRASQAHAPTPPAPQAVASRLQTLQGLIQEPDADRRALKIQQLPSDYLKSKQLRVDIRALLANGVGFKQAALKLHPDKVIPSANVASARDAEQLHTKVTALWQAVTDIKNQEA